MLHFLDNTKYFCLGRYIQTGKKKGRKTVYTLGRTLDTRGLTSESYANIIT